MIWWMWEISRLWKEKEDISAAINNLLGRGGWHPKGGEIIARPDSGSAPYELKWIKDGKVDMKKFERPKMPNASTWEESIARALGIGKG